ncbi:hypothetical protein ABZ490_17740 [Streptomyces sp. NPDC005811]|uniref:hypothetical protein n=1 Tax=Streptomyces sp. NPDC005811 TaxID=3154565 RepID=UPI00341157A2
MDLLDWHRDRLSARRLAVLVAQLPRDSALNRELHGDAAEWSVTDHLLAAVVDHLAAANWMFASVNSDEGDQPDPPVPVPRPGDGSEPENAEEAEDAEDPDEGKPGGAPLGPPSPVQLARFFA